LREKFSQVDSAKKGLETGAKSQASGAPAEFKESVDLSPIVVRPGSEVPETTKPSVLGKVLAVNKENNFVIVDIGEDAGIKVGDTFAVYRNDDQVATVEVIRASKTVSACDIKRQSTPLKIGDIIK
jgi:hypothetical protein